MLNVTALKISMYMKNAVKLEDLLKTSLETTYPTDNAKSQKACVAKTKNPISIEGGACKGTRITKSAISVLSSRRIREAKEWAKKGLYSEVLT